MVQFVSLGIMVLLQGTKIHKMTILEITNSSYERHNKTWRRLLAFHQQLVLSTSQLTFNLIYTLLRILYDRKFYVLRTRQFEPEKWILEAMPRIQFQILFLPNRKTFYVVFHQK